MTGSEKPSHRRLHGHDHSHHHGPAHPVSAHVRLLLVAVLVPFALLTVIGMAALWSRAPAPTMSGVGYDQQVVQGVVTAVSPASCTVGGQDPGAVQSPLDSPQTGAEQGCETVSVRLAGGPDVGKTITQMTGQNAALPRFHVGDRVVLTYQPGVPADVAYQLVDFVRGTPMLALALLFALVVVVFGRWQGLAALAAMAVTFAILIWFVLPAILAGRPPLLVAVVGSAAIMLVALYLTHGPSARTSTAVLGTLASLVITGLLGVIFTGWTRVTGLDQDASLVAGLLETRVDLRGLLLAGIIIGTLGVLDDVTVTQAAAVWELREANPALGFAELYRAGVRIGRAHTASTVNTLVLAYAGAALPLLLLFSLAQRGLGDLLTTEVLAVEIVRTLVGSIGLVAAVPITTALAAVVALQEPVEPGEPATGAVSGEGPLRDDPHEPLRP